MAVIRKASFDAYAAAREVGEDNPARSARQAVATAHVPRRAYGPAIYAQQAGRPPSWRSRLDHSTNS